LDNLLSFFFDDQTRRRCTSYEVDFGHENLEKKGSIAFGIHGRPQTFSRGGQKFSKGGGKEPTCCLKNDEKDTIFPKKV
jgi:hypothetical protein